MFTGINNGQRSKRQTQEQRLQDFGYVHEHASLHSAKPRIGGVLFKTHGWAGGPS